MVTTNLLTLPAPPAGFTRGGNLYEASRQWAFRPDDQRYLDLPSLAASVNARREKSKEYTSFKVADLKADYVKEGPEAGALYPIAWGKKPVAFTNWSFNQYNSMIGGPNIGWLRDMPPPIATMALQASLEYRGRVAPGGEVKLYLTPPEGEAPSGSIRAITSTSYGRIFDSQVVAAVQHINQDDRWHVPLKAYGGQNSKRATTLYASDRDVFIFLVDEAHPIEIDGEVFFKGFFIWNSEVGSSTFGVKTFLYRYICCNRIVWDAVSVRELNIRHTNKAPDRFIQEAAPLLASYADANTVALQEKVTETKKVIVAKDIAGAEAWLKDRGFGLEQARVIVNLAEQNGGAEAAPGQSVRSTDPTNLWNLAQGITAFARNIPHQDERVAIETKAGDLLTTFGKGRPDRFRA